MSVEKNLSPAARRTLPGRTAFQAKFTTPEEKTEFYRQLGKQSARERVTLSGAERRALSDAYALLGRIVARIDAAEAAATPGPSPQPPPPWR